MPARSVEQLSLDFLPQTQLVVQRHQGQISSDAGLLPLAEFDQRLGYTAALARCLDDGKTGRGHSILSMLRQRFYGILAGYEDCNDHDTLRDDPIFKMVAGKLPEDDPLASQPTLSRFENQITPRQLQDLVDFIADSGVQRLKQSNAGELPASITLDLDATDDPTHGHQQLTLFHGYFGQYQYFPLIISEPTTRHVMLAWLRPGTVHAALGADDDLMRVVNALRKQRPDIAIHVRGDAGFGVPWMYEICEKNGLTYTFGFATNARLKQLTEGLMEQAVRQYEQTKQKQRLFECFQYQCDSWSHPRTVVAKAECHQQGTNLRFVVSNLPGVSTPEDGQREYDHYIQRGESEHRMDELKNGLHTDRLSCHRFLANQCRLLLHAAAYWLVDTLRRWLAAAGQPRLQLDTLRMRLLKIGGRVWERATHVPLRLASSHPGQALWALLAARQVLRE